MSRYAQPMSQILAQMQEAKKITKKERDELEDDNQHGELALRLAQSFGTPQEVKKIKDINKRHMQRGSIDPKDQAARDKISNKYYKMAEETELDEAMKYNFMILDPDGKVMGMSSDEKRANDMAKPTGNLLKLKGRVVKLRKPMSSTRGDRLIGMLPADNLGEALDKKDEPIKKLWIC